jgi:hypothetical protein
MHKACTFSIEINKIKSMNSVVKYNIPKRFFSTIAYLTIICSSSCSMDTNVRLAKEDVMKYNFIALKNSVNVSKSNQPIQSMLKTERVLNESNRNNITDDFRYGIMFR